MCTSCLCVHVCDERWVRITVSQSLHQGCSPTVRSVLLLSELNARHVCGVLRYLKRTDTPLPPELLQFAQGVQQAKEQLKTDRALCSYLKSLGFCRYIYWQTVN